MERLFEKDKLPEDLRELHQRLVKCLGEAADILLPARGPERDKAILVPQTGNRVIKLALAGMNRELQSAPGDLRRRYFEANPEMLETLLQAGLVDRTGEQS